MGSFAARLGDSYKNAPKKVKKVTQISSKKKGRPSSKSDKKGKKPGKFKKKKKSDQMPPYGIAANMNDSPNY